MPQRGVSRLSAYIRRLLVRASLAMTNLTLQSLAWCCFRREKRSVQCILVFRSSAIGDFLCCLPALAYLRKMHPAASIHLLTMATGVRKYRGDARFLAGGAILSDPQLVDEVHLFDNTRLFSLPYLREMRARMRALHPDRVFLLPQTGALFPGMVKKILFLRSLGLTRNVTGYRLYQLGFLRKTQFAMGLYVHQVTAAMRAAGGNVSDAVEFHVSRPQSARHAVDRRWVECGLGPPDGLICVFVGAKFDHKRWPIENFVEICRRISTHLRASLILIGGAQEVPLARALQSMLLPPPVDFVGKLDLLETAEVLRRCRLHVGNDSGPAHLSAAVGTPCITITSGIAFPGSWEAWGRDNITLRHRVSCEYCFGEDHCPTGTMDCIRGIGVDEVWQAVLTLWSRTSSASRAATNSCESHHESPTSCPL
jgi:ADP-heptose:LPS heptosyltransferase